MTAARVQDVALLAAAFGADMKAADGKAEAAKASAGPGIGEYAGLAAAVTDNPGGSVRINYDEQALPSDFAGVLLEYTKRATTRNISQRGWSPDQAYRTLRIQHPTNYPDVKHSTLNIETLAKGSLKNGPYSADYGATISVAKEGFASGSAVGGEIDGLTIYVRQDGPRGLPSADAGSSDACGILINAQNIADVGFVAPIEATSSNIQGVAPYAEQYAIQSQMAPLNMNAAGGPITYGHVVVSKVGANKHAYYAGNNTGASWENLFYSPDRVRITFDGSYAILAPGWSDGGLRLSRVRATDGNSEIRHRGTGALLIAASEAAAIQFATSNITRAQFTAGGNFRPMQGQAINLGDPAARWITLFSERLDVSGNQVTFSGLPVYADNAAALAGGLTAGRVYRTATGQWMVTY